MLNERLEALRAGLTDRSVNAVLVTHPNNRFYLSGYTGEDDPPNESAGVLLITQDRAFIFAPPNNVEWAASEAQDFEAMAWRRPWEGSIAERAQELGIERLGIEKEALPLASFETLSQKLNGSLEFVAVDDTVSDLRAIKTPDEVQSLQRALKLTDDVFVACTGNLAPGITERELARNIERTMREMGADNLAFHTIVASGPHAARPHHQVTDRALSLGEPIVIDMGARVDGYNGDLTRTIWLGEPNSRLKDVYNMVLDAQQAALDGIRAGMSGKDADRLARAVVEDAGYGDYFSHGLGHGLGLRVHEAPSASASATALLRAGEVLTVEPGIYIQGWGGVRLEDVVLIEEHGARNMTTAPKHVRF